jgi:hypothetical protein
LRSWAEKGQRREIDFSMVTYCILNKDLDNFLS